MKKQYRCLSIALTFVAVLIMSDKPRAGTVLYWRGFIGPGVVRASIGSASQAQCGTGIVWGVKIQGYDCVFTLQAEADGIINIGASLPAQAGQLVWGGPGYENTPDGLTNAYVPKSGYYHLKYYGCPGAIQTPGRCTIRQSVVNLTSNKSVFFDSGLSVGTTTGDFGGAPFTRIADYSSHCFTLLEDSTNKEYKSNIGIMCQDAGDVRGEPATCTLSTPSLTFTLGDTDKNSVPPAPAASIGADGNVIKTVDVTCTGDKPADFLTSFIYTPVTYSGIGEPVNTDNPAVGIQIFYNGQPVKNGAKINETFNAGTTTQKTLEFQLVRDPAIDSTNIKTGPYNAYAIMIMDQQ